jgi:hypothetical protein
MPLLQPEPITVKSMDGEDLEFVISRLPATLAREVVTQYPLSALPKLGDYPRNEELMLKLMRYVGVPGKGKDGEPLVLATRALVDNHIPDMETLAKIEMAMLEKNCSFFSRGGVSSFLEVVAERVQSLISQTLTASLQQLSKND